MLRPAYKDEKGIGKVPYPSVIAIETSTSGFLGLLSLVSSTKSPDLARNG